MAQPDRREVVELADDIKIADKFRAIAFSIENLVDFVEAEIVCESQGSKLTIRIEKT